ncbi:MAG: VWA domain-containing protein, partial [Deltaproteobacteria bacterium]|nr:VWA domain-containing protein [Deltaproteobacteria bacterium]
DPGLVEYVESELVEVKVFPVPASGQQRVELTYSGLVDYQGGLYRFRYPMKTDQQATTTLQDFTLHVTLTSKAPLKNLYSPTHKLAVRTRSDGSRFGGSASMEKAGFSLADDLLLYWTVDDKDVGVSVLSYREGDEPGYFLLLASPRDDLRDQEIIGKRVAFVVDTSGSMEGEKMTATKAALDQCLQRLGEDDLFSIVSFGGYAEAWKPKMVAASKGNVAGARAFVQQLEPLGGTNIGEALDVAFATTTGSEKAPLMVVFLTDGRPTVGDTDVAALVKRAEAGRKDKAARLFVLGVGDDLNTILLDKMSSQNGGSALYVKGNAALTDEVRAFYERISHPVLADLTLAVDGVDVSGVHPRALGDLFMGQQLVAVGRYRAPGHARLTLTGQGPRGARTFSADVDFAAATTEHAFVPRLWAQRQVGALLDEIREKGEQRGLVDEVTQLATRFGIVTPYTSYLVLEPGFQTTPSPAGPLPPPPRPLVRGGIEEREGAVDDAASGAWAPSASTTSSAPPAELAERVEQKARAARESLKADGGASGVAAAKEIGRLKRGEALSTRAVTTEARALGRRFLFADGFFVDATASAVDETLVVAAWSDAWFAVLRLRPELKAALALGERVKARVGKGRTLVVDVGSGVTRADDAKLKVFLGP